MGCLDLFLERDPLGERAIGDPSCARRMAGLNLPVDQQGAALESRRSVQREVNKDLRANSEPELARQ
jgi:hypothetical protein